MVVAAQSGRQIDVLHRRPLVLHEECEQLLPLVDVAEAGVARVVRLGGQAAGDLVLLVRHPGALPVEHSPTVLHDGGRGAVERHVAAVLATEHNLVAEIRRRCELGEDGRELVVLALLVVGIVGPKADRRTRGAINADEATPRRPDRDLGRNFSVEPQRVGDAVKFVVHPFVVGVATRDGERIAALLVASLRAGRALDSAKRASLERDHAVRLTRAALAAEGHDAADRLAAVERALRTVRDLEVIAGPETGAAEGDLVVGVGVVGPYAIHEEECLVGVGPAQKERGGRTGRTRGRRRGAGDAGQRGAEVVELHARQLGGAERIDGRTGGRERSGRARRGENVVRQDDGGILGRETADGGREAEEKKASQGRGNGGFHDLLLRTARADRHLHGGGTISPAN